MSAKPAARPSVKSLRILSWLVRVGAAPDAPLALASGCCERRVRSHVSRLAHDGYVRRVPMTHGEGSLIVVTREGALRVGEGRFGALRSVAPSTWAHHVASAWVAASFEVRGRSWVGPREIQIDDSWRARVSYADPAGGTRHVMHRPDLGRRMSDGPVAIEVELQRKSKARLQGVMEMYADRILGPEPTLASVVYIAGNPDVAQLVEGVGQAVGLTKSVFRVMSLTDVIESTRSVAP